MTIPLPIGINPESILKLDVKWIEEEDGSGTILIEWDEEDADLQWWTDLGQERQQQFMINALEVAVENTLSNEGSGDGT